MQNKQSYKPVVEVILIFDKVGCKPQLVRIDKGHYI